MYTQVSALSVSSGFLPKHKKLETRESGGANEQSRKKVKNHNESMVLFVICFL